MFEFDFLSSVQMTDFRFFDFTVVQKQYTLSRNCTLKFDSGSVPRLEARSTTFAHGAGQPAGSRWPVMARGTQSAPTHPFQCALSVQCSINYLRYSTLY